MTTELLGQLQEVSAASPAAFGLVVLAGLIMGVAPVAAFAMKAR